MTNYKVEAMDSKAEQSVKDNPHLDILFYGDKGKAWDMVEVLQKQGYGEFCVVEVK